MTAVENEILVTGVVRDRGKVAGRRTGDGATEAISRAQAREDRVPADEHWSRRAVTSILPATCRRHQNQADATNGDEQPDLGHHVRCNLLGSPGPDEALGILTFRPAKRRWRNGRRASFRS